MSYKILDGNIASNKVYENLRVRLDRLHSRNINPSLAVIMVGDNPASRIYVNNKINKCNELGIISKSYFLPDNVDAQKLKDLIEKLNNDNNIHGILLQLPLPKHLNQSDFISLISPNKDVDCFSSFNIGQVFKGIDTIEPCTPKGIIYLLKSNNIDIEGKHVVIVGRSNIVGKPLALMMINEGATVTVCNSKTKDLKDKCKQADILIVAIGKAKFIDSSYMKDGVICVDVGMNRQDNKLCGDIDFSSAIQKAHWISPVPGGVGKMTVAMLLSNLVSIVEDIYK